MFSLRMVMNGLGGVKKARTTTPPMSNRMAFGGFRDVMMDKFRKK
jgi:hypothetical protein